MVRRADELGEKMMVEYTDAASDMADIIRTFRGQPASNKPAWQVIELVTGIPPSEFWNLFGVIGSRVAGLRRLTVRIEDPDFRKSMKSTALQAIDRFSGVLSPPNLTAH